MDSSAKISLHKAHKKDLSIKMERLLSSFRSMKNGSELEGKNYGEIVKAQNSEDFDKLACSIFDKCPKEYISKSTIESHLCLLFSEIMDRGTYSMEEIENDMENIETRLASEIKEWRVIIPIDNLDIEDDLKEIWIGNIKFTNFETVKEEIKTKLLAPEIRITDPRYLKNTEVLFETQFYKEFEDKICAIFSIIGDKSMAYQKALLTIENIVNIIRVFMPFSCNSDLIKIGVGEGHTSRHATFYFDECGSGWHAEFRATRFKVPYVMTAKNLESFRKNHNLSNIETILCKDLLQRSQLEKSILLSIRWMGMGLHEEVISDRFIKFSIALECLLINEREEKSKTESLAERAAFLVGNDPANRYDVYKQIKSFYRIRSQIVHEGLTEVSPADAYVFYNLAVSCLIKALAVIEEKNLQDKLGLIDFIDKKKMGLYFNI